MHFNIPEIARVNKLIPVDQIIQKTGVSEKIKKEFLNRIKGVKWLYRLSEETMGIPKTKNVSEVQIIEIEVNRKRIPENVLHVIDGLINYNILYLFKYNDDYAWGIAVKRKGVTEGYYFSRWKGRLELTFKGINIENLYKNLVLAFIPEHFYCSECFQAIELYNHILDVNRDIEEISKKLFRETNTHKIATLNKQLSHKKAELIAISERHRRVNN